MQKTEKFTYTRNFIIILNIFQTEIILLTYINEGPSKHFIKGGNTMDKRPTDADIIELLFARDERALNMTDKKYGKYLFAVAFNILHDRLDCEECRNDTYLDTWNAIPPARPASLKAFLTRIIHCKAVNRYNHKRAGKRIPSEMTVSIEELHAALESGEETVQIHQAEELGQLIEDFLKKAPERQRHIFIERYYMAQSAENIARELGLTVWSIYKELDKIKENLRSYLAENEVYV